MKTTNLRWITRNMDYLRVPLNASERAEMRGNIPYWGANGIVDYLDDFVLDERVILIGEDGAPFFDRDKDVAFISDGAAWINNHIHILKPDRRIISDRYLKYFLNQLDYSLYINGSTRDKLTQSQLGNISITYPDLSTQREIADFLDRETARIDLLIEKKQKLVALLGEKFEGTVSHLTSPPDHDHKGWIERPIKAFCNIFGRIGFRGYTTEDIVDEGEGAITLSPSNIKDGRMVLEGRTYLSWAKYNESPEIQIVLGDIVFVKTGSTIGKVAKVDDLPEPMTLNPQLVVLKNVAVDSDFLLFSMLSRAFQYQVSFNRFGGSTPAMSQGHLGRLRVWLPEDRNEQRKIVELICQERDRVDAIKVSLKTSIDRLKEYRSALITAAVTGQIDVTTYVKSGTTDRRLDAIQEEMGA